MSTGVDLTVSQRALLALKEMRSKLSQLDRSRSEPIAIVGIGCRFPGGVTDASSYWSLLKEGRNAVTEVPAMRWPIDRYYHPDADNPGTINTRYGGFIERVDEFDAPFFGISGFEAQNMDPQQRLMLEVTKEAFDDAGATDVSLAASKTGVFVGVAHSEYAWLNLRNRFQSNCYTATGSFGAIIANRISYVFDLRGPSFTVDAVCSASLLAVHLAVQAIRSGECTQAIVGGSGLLLVPEGLVWFAKLGVLCPDGRCKAFDHRGNGIILGEGVAAVMLKPLSAALADGNPIYAVIRGSATAQDGRSNGMTAPSRQAQEVLLRDAYQNARVDPKKVHYIEAHGTGTILGDPIEAHALGAIVGEGRLAEKPCLLGSVKTNLGHLQMVGGIAGLIKVALALKHGELPPSLHYEEANPHIPFSELGLRVHTKHTAWPYPGPRLAGVTSLSFGGTNVHVVLESAPPQPSEEPREDSGRASLLVFSAKSEAALFALAGRYRALASKPDVSLDALTYSASVRRDAHEHRASVVVKNRESLLDMLSALEQGRLKAGVALGRTAHRVPRKIAFVFSGQGSQWPRMGTTLAARDPVFAAALDRVDAAIAQYAPWSVKAEMARPAGETNLERLEIIQTCVFAIQVALVDRLAAYGITPFAVVGHSMGEVAAAYASGALDLDAAARVIVTRSRLIQTIAGRGAMVLASLAPAEAAELLRGKESVLSVAAINGPKSVVISGDPEAAELVLTELQGRNVFCSRIKSDAAGHCPQMDPLLPDLRAQLASLPTSVPTTLFVSTVTGREGAEPHTEYWARNLRGAVLFWPAVNRLIELGCDTFLEVSPHPILLPGIDQGFRASGAPRLLVPLLVRNEDEEAMILGALGTLFVNGHPLDWERVHPAPGRIMRLPLYPFQRERYWLEEVVSADDLDLDALARAGQPGARPKAPRTEFVQSLLAAPKHTRKAVLAEKVSEAVGKALGRALTEPERDLGFFQLGMTSLQAMELKSSLEDAVGRVLPSTLAFEYPTIEALATVLLTSHFQLDDAEALLAAGRAESAKDTQLDSRTPASDERRSHLSQARGTTRHEATLFCLTDLDKSNLGSAVDREIGLLERLLA